MKIYDISVPISNDMPIYQGDPGVEITPVSRISAGDSANVSLLKFGDHTGTHIDPPFHFLENGLTIDQLPLERLIGECLVCAMGDTEEIGAAELEQAKIPTGTKRILFKTRNSALWSDSAFHKDFTHLNADGADWLVERGMEVVGIDYLSVDRFKSGNHPVHCRLIGAGITIIEGVCLADVPEGIYELICLPLKIKGGDGGPSRAVLIER